MTLPISVVVAWRLRRQHEREAGQAASPAPEHEHAAERIVRLGPGAKPQKRDLS